MGTLRWILLLACWFAKNTTLHAQPVLSDLAAVEFEDGQMGTVVASRNGTHHIAILITRTQDATAPLLDDVEVLFAKSKRVQATLVRRIPVDDRYILGLYRCQFVDAWTSAPTIDTENMAGAQPLYVVLDDRPAAEHGVFEPRLRKIMTYTAQAGNTFEARPDPATRGPRSAPVFTATGSLIGITMDEWSAREARVAVALLPIARLRGLILEGQGTSKGPTGLACEQFDLREAATGRNTCEQQEHQEKLEAERIEAANARLRQREEQRQAQGRALNKLERRMVKSPLTVAPFLGWGGGNEFKLRPTGGMDLYVMPDRYFQVRMRLQGGLLYADRTYEDVDAMALGFNRIRSSSQFAEGLLGFSLGKGDIYFSALFGYGMETPATLLWSMGDEEVRTITATEPWLRPVSQFDLGIQIAPVRLSLGFRTAHGAVPTIYKAQQMGLPWMFAWPSKDLPANGTMIVLEFSYRLWGWWNRDMKKHAADEYRAAGGVDPER